jgi:hypothetical protein
MNTPFRNRNTSSLVGAPRKSEANQHIYIYTKQKQRKQIISKTEERQKAKRRKKSKPNQYLNCAHTSGDDNG